MWKEQWIILNNNIRSENKEMGKMIDNYSLQECLGEGVYAKVYRAVHVKTLQEVAIKVIQASKFRDIPKLEQCTVNEVNILSQLKEESDFIVKYIDMLKTTNNFYFVYQFCNGGTLDVLLKREGTFPQKKAIEFLRQILQGFRILSKHNIMHRDLKPDNILVHNGSLKLADFGFCKPLEHKNDLAQTMLGSPIYMAPEVLKGEIYTLKADVWSMGVVFYQMLFGKCPFESKSIAMLIKQLEVQNLYIPDTPKISSATEDFLRRVLVKDYNQRVSWEDIFSCYHITDQGEIINKKQMAILQQNLGGDLRSSIKSNNGQYPNGAMRVSLAYNNSIGNTSSPVMSNMTSPKAGQVNNNSLQVNNNGAHSNFNRSYDGNNLSQNTLTMRKSPMKPGIEPRGTIEYGSRAPNLQVNTATTSGTNSTASNSGNHHGQQISNLKTEKNGGTATKAERPTRMDILLKNHMKSLQIHQLVMEIYGLEQKYANYISYFIFKNVCKQIEALYENLKKESTSDNFPNQQAYKQFRQAVEGELDQSQLILSSFAEVLMEEETQNKMIGAKMKNSGTLMDEINENRHKIMKNYIEGLKDTDEDIRLAAQVVDYLEEFILIKKDAYERMSRDHLFRQMRAKMLKY